ncbi:MAG TPA: glucan 1,4-alpha-glucosidase [Anaerolineales bacterium]
MNANHAPGAPGIPPTWTSSAKTGVGTALSGSSRVWFTLSHGILDEIYYPRLDQACTRDLGLLITDGKSFFSEEKRDASHQVSYLAEGAPAYRLVNTCQEKGYSIEKEILADPRRDVVLQQTRFTTLAEALGDYHLYALLAPHLNNQGSNNTAWLGEYKGRPMLLAEANGRGLALACSTPWLMRSAGYVGQSDGWQDLHAHYRLTWEYERAENGNVALTGEIDLQASGGAFLLALGFGFDYKEAAQRAHASLLEGFENARGEYVQQWKGWQQTLLPLDSQHPEPGVATTRSSDFAAQENVYRASAAVMRIHEAKAFPGGLIASLAIPWGFAKGDDDLGGYHLVWVRDMVEAVGGLLAAGAHGDARRVLRYLQSTQEADGHWPQNMWLDGSPFWNGIQLDEAVFPVLLIDLAYREQALTEADLKTLWPMARKALEFMITNGPVTQQDRWEEDPGYSPFTLAVEICALLAGADLAERSQEAGLAAYLRETADLWNANIERWIYVTDTDLSRQVGVEGYYIRLAAPDTGGASSPKSGWVPIKNRPADQTDEPAAQIVSPDALALVRFGLRAADDPHVLNTVKVIDALLKVDTPSGPSWRRYNDDGYGEHAGGEPYDGTGIGRLWPLLVGERAHYELAAGHKDEAERLLSAMEAFANPGGMLPEQTWDSPDIPDKELYFGRPSGSAMPLVWAHAEYVKLRRSLRDGLVFDMPPQPVQRYIKDRTGTPFAFWRFNQKIGAMPAGKKLRIEVRLPAQVHWSTDGWQTTQDMPTRDTGIGLHLVDLPLDQLSPGQQVVFTFHWQDRWEGTNYSVNVV